MAHAKTAILILATLLAGCDEIRQQGDAYAAVTDKPEIREWLADMNTLPNAASTPQQPAAPVNSLIGGLEKRLENDPDDLKGWRLLAQSHAFLGDMQAARSAVGRAVELGADEQELEAIVMSAHTGGRR